MGLEEHELRAWVQRVATGEANRRDFLRTMLGLGLAGPVIADMLATYAPAAAQDRRDVRICRRALIQPRSIRRGL